MLVKHKLYSFIFAGQKMKGKYIRKETLHDGAIVYIFEQDNYKYPIRKENICGNLKQ